MDTEWREGTTRASRIPPAASTDRSIHHAISDRRSRYHPISSAHRPPGRGAGGGTRRPARPDRSPRRPRPRRWTAAGTRRARPTTPTPTPELRPLFPPRPHRPRRRLPRPSHRASSPRVGMISPPQPPRAPPPRAPSPAPPSTPPSPRLPSFRLHSLVHEMKPQPRPTPASASHPPRHPPRTRRRGQGTAPRTSRSRVWRVPSPTTKACRPRGTPRCPPPDRHLYRSRRRRLSCHHPLHRRPSRRARAWRR